jgi:hypothetical protein
MSKLSDIKLLNKSISQGSIYQINKKNTLGSFTTLEGVSKEPSHTSIESFLPNASHTDAANSRVQDSGGSNVRYEDLSLNELYEIYSGKIASLDQALELFNPTAPDEGDNYVMTPTTSANNIAYTSDGGSTYLSIPYNDAIASSIDGSVTMGEAGYDATLSDSNTTDQALLTCGNMPTDSGIPSSPTSHNLNTVDIQNAAESLIKASICNPYTNSTYDSGNESTNFEDIINLIAQLNEIAEQMKIKMDAAGADSDTSIGSIPDVTQTLDYYTSRFEYMLKYKVRFSDITDVDTPPSSITDNSSGYLEIEGLKFESAQLLYMSLLLGTLVAGAVTVGAIIKSNKQ